MDRLAHEHRRLVRADPRHRRCAVLRSDVAAGRDVRAPAVGDLRAVGVFAGGFCGALTATLLDAIMHSDLRPFWPVYDGNPLLNLVSLGVLHLACIATGLFGAALLWYTGHRKDRLTKG